MFSCSKIEQKQLNTWVSFQSAEQPLLGQFSVSGNSVQWDGTPPPQPSVENPVFGKIYLTHHTLVEYLDETKGECKPENVFPRLARVVRDLNREVTLPAEVLRHKQHRHAGNQNGVRYLGSMAGWQLVTRPALDQSGLLAITVYQRQQI